MMGRTATLMAQDQKSIDEVGMTPTATADGRYAWACPCGEVGKATYTTRQETYEWAYRHLQQCETWRAYRVDNWGCAS